MDESNQIKTVQGRWMTIDEEIYLALDIHTMSLYTALRYEGDFAQETSKVVKSRNYLCQRAKIRKTQFYASMNILEELGLVKRCNEQRLGEVGLIYVSKHMNHFKTACHMEKPVHDMHEVVRTANQVVRTADTYQESSNNTTTTYEECTLPPSAPELSPLDLIQIFHEELPDNPEVLINKANGRIEPLVLREIKGFKKWWLAETSKNLTGEKFRAYLLKMKSNAPGFCNNILPQAGRRNGIKAFLDPFNALKLMNGEIY